MQVPDEAAASEIARQHVCQPPIAVRRFTNGIQHYVYEISFEQHAPLVVRMTVPSQRLAMVGAKTLSAALRPLGVPLPEIVACELHDPFPWLILKRLAGTDIGDVLAHLDTEAIDRIARDVAKAQRNTAKLETASRYGYAVHAQDAPHRSWSDVVCQHIARSSKRIASAGLFDPSLVKRIEAFAHLARDEMNSIPAIPFLHDATVKNVIVTDEGQLSGIVDVDDLCFGDPRYSIALTLAASIVRGLPDEYAARLLHHGGHPDDWLFRFYVAVYLLDLMSEHGQDFNGNERKTTDLERNRILALYLDALARLGDRT